MRSPQSGIGLGAGAATLLCVMAGVGCSGTETAPPRQRAQLRLAWPTTGTFATELAAAHRQSADVDVSIVEGIDALRAVQEGRADITVTLADMAYFAYRDAPRIRSIASLEVIPLHVVVRKDSGIERLSDLRGRSVAGRLTRAASLVLDAAGLAGNVDYVSMSAQDGKGRPSAPSDALFVVSYFPNAAVETALRDGGRLLPIEGDAVDRAERRYPFIRRTTIPSNSYPGQSAAVPTIGTNMLYICRQELDEELVHALAEGLFRALPHMSERIRSLRLVNVDAASAVPIPLHEGAARYYREREVE